MKKLFFPFCFAILVFMAKAQQPVPYLYQDSLLNWKGFWITTETTLPAPGGGVYLLYYGSFIALTPEQVQSYLNVINGSNPNNPPIQNGGPLPSCSEARNYMNSVRCGPTIPSDPYTVGGATFCFKCNNQDNTLCRGWYVDNKGTRVIIGGCGL